MADLASSSLTPRPVAAPEAAGRVVGRAASASDHAAPQQHDPQADGRHPAPHDDAARAGHPHGHHDPAVFLAATLAQVETGAILAAALQGLNAHGLPVVAADATQYLVSADAKLLPRVLAALENASSATILVVSVERTITAMLVAVDGKPLPASLPITLTVIKTDPGVDKLQPPAPPAPAATITYQPAPTFDRPQNTDDVFLPTAAAPHGSTHMEQHAAVLGPATSSPRRNVSIPLSSLENIDRPQQPAPPAILASFQSVLLPLPTEDTATPSIPRPVPAPVSVTVTSRTTGAAAINAPTSAPTVQGIVKELPKGPTPSTPSIPGNSSAPASSPPSRAIETPLGLIPLPPEMDLPRNAVVMVRISPAPSQPAADLLADQASPSGVTLPVSTAPAAAVSASAWMTPWPDTLLPDPHEPWPLMQSLMAATAMDPAFHQALMSKLPSPERPINPAFLLFLNLLGVSSPAKLLLGSGGETWFRQNGAEETLSRWQKGMEQLKAVGADRAAGEWRPFMIPFHNPQNPHAHGIESILMLVRHSPGEPEQDQSQSGTPQDGKDGRVTRFILDLQLSRLGATQIDGIIQGKIFNLAIRTERPLGSAQQRDLRDIFIQALENNHFSGDISFPCGLPFPVDGAREWHAALKTGGVLSA